MSEMEFCGKPLLLHVVYYVYGSEYVHKS